MAGRDNLGAASKAKKDEFYTQLTDIEKELRHYRQHFKDKVVFCNCDDPFESDFFKYFVLQFNRLGLKKLICTCYAGSPVMGKQLSLFDIEPEAKPGTPYKAIVTSVRDVTGDGGIDMNDIVELFKTGENSLTELVGNGDFRSEECLELLDEADIVVTNPPFSLFRKYVALLLEHKKKFVIIGTMNAITYKEIFPLLKQNEIWLGNKTLSGGMDMIVPEKVFDAGRVKKFTLNKFGERIVNVMGVCWFTNLDLKKRHEELILVKRYTPDAYPKYDNFDAIEVSHVSDIPCDYAGMIGVPITFMDKYNPNQFEIIGSFNNSSLEKKAEEHYVLSLDTPTIINGVEKFWNGPVINKVPFYKRIIIRNKHPETPKEH